MGLSRACLEAWSLLLFLPLTVVLVQAGEAVGRPGETLALTVLVFDAAGDFPCPPMSSSIQCE